MAKRKKRNRGGGVPFNPDVDTGTKRPVTARVAVGDVNDKFSDYPSNGLTPRRLARIFREADEGNVRAQMELFEEMEEKDTHLFSQMQTRKLAVTGLDWEVQPFSEDEIDKEIADFIDEQLKGIENFDEVLIDMLDAIGKGISIMELAWTVEDGRNVIEDIEYVHPKKLVWDSTINPWKCDNIFRTNMQTALNAGHYKSMTDETTMKLRPYWRYRTAGDGHVRESHAVMEGRVYRADDPIWDVWYPPNGFRCRCMVVSLSKKQVERMGLHVETEAPYDVDYSTGEILTKFPDKGFSNNPAKTVWKPDMTNISPELRKMFRERKQPEDGETK